MGRSINRRRKRCFVQTNPKRLHKKALSLPKIKCGPLKAVWNSKISYKENMKNFGLASDSNKTVGVSNKEIVNVSTANRKEIEVVKMEVIHALEEKSKKRAPKTFRFPPTVVRHCVYLIERYGEDYSAMARDRKNYFQETPNQIKKKIDKFKKVPQQWNAYLRAKGLPIEGTDIPAGEESDVIDIDEILNENT